MINDSTDIIIVGGGIAGYAAAMAASENNSVTIIEKNSALGGATTQTNVGTLCGLYLRSPSPVLVSHPFCQSFVEELFRYDRQAKLVSMPNDLHVVSYEWTNLQKLITSQLNSKKVNVLYDSTVTGVETEDDSIKSIQLNKKKNITAKAFIDCSGNGHLAQLLNHKMIKADEYQAASQVFRLKNVKSENEYSLNLALKKAMVKNSEVNRWPKAYSSLSVIPGSLSNNKVDLKLPLKGKIAEGENQSAVLKKEVDQILPELLSAIREVESLADSSIEIVFPSPGIRIQQRPEGKNILTEDDVMNCKKPDDGIAIGTWPIEEWDYDGKVNLSFFNENDGYSIQAGCLVSPSYKNLFFAGKNISAETRAIASARVTGTCLQTGYAAGKFSGCINDDEKEKAIREIHNLISARQ